MIEGGATSEQVLVDRECRRVARAYPAADELIAAHGTGERKRRFATVAQRPILRGGRQDREQKA